MALGLKVLLVLGLGNLVLCDDSACDLHCPPLPADCHYEGAVHSDRCTEASCGTVVCSDASVTDASCDVCPQLGPGCRYLGQVSCTPVVCPPTWCGPYDAGFDVDAPAPLNCSTEADGSVFAAFDRSCMVDTDCAIVWHQADCCGSLEALGLRRVDREAFATRESLCRGMLPECGCSPLPIRTEDGRFPPSTDRVGVTCLAGRCRSVLQ